MDLWGKTLEDIQYLGYDSIDDFTQYQDVFSAYGRVVSKEQAMRGVGPLSPPTPIVGTTTTTPTAPVFSPPTSSNTKQPITPVRPLPVTDAEIETAGAKKQLAEQEKYLSAGHDIPYADIGEDVSTMVTADRDITGARSFNPFGKVFDALDWALPGLGEAMQPQKLQSAEDRAAWQSAYDAQREELTRQGKEYYAEQASMRPNIMSEEEYLANLKDVTEEWTVLAPMDVAGPIALKDMPLDELLSQRGYERGISPVNKPMGILAKETGGELVETAFGAGIRGLNVVSATLLEFPEQLGLIEDRPFVDKMRTGEGYESAAVNLAKQYTDNEDLINAAWGAGLLLEFLVPLPTEIPGYASRLAKTAVGKAVTQSLVDSARLIPGASTVEAGMKTLSEIPHIAATKRLATAVGESPETLRTIAKQNGWHIADLRTRILAAADSLPSIKPITDLVAKVLKTGEATAEEIAVLKANRMPIVQNNQLNKAALNQLRRSYASALKIDATLTPQRYIARELVRAKIDSAVSAGKVVQPTQAIIAPGVLTDVSDVDRVKKKLRTHPVMNKLTAAMLDDSKGFIQLSQGVVNDLKAIGVSGITAGKVSLTEANKILARAIYNVAEQLPEVTTLARLQKTAELTTSTGVSDVLRRAISSVNIERTFTPPMIRPQGFLALWNKTIKPLDRAVGASDAVRTAAGWSIKGRDPISLLIQTELVERIAGIGNEFKDLYRRFVTEGASSDEAYAAVLSHPFAGNSRDLFTYYMGALYGGVDDVTDMYLTRAGGVTSTVPNAGLNKFWNEVFDAAETGGEGAMFELVKAYRAASTDVERVKILTLLSKLAARDELRNIAKFNPDLVKSMTANMVGGLRPVYGPSSAAIPFFAAFTDRTTANIATELIDTLRLSSNDILSIRQVSRDAVRAIEDGLSDVLIRKAGVTDEQVAEYFRKSYMSYLLREEHGLHKADALLDQELIDMGTVFTDKRNSLFAKLEAGESFENLDIAIRTLNKVRDLTKTAELTGAWELGVGAKISTEDLAELARFRKVLAYRSPGKTLFQTMQTVNYRAMTSAERELFINGQRNALAKEHLAERIERGTASPAEGLFDSEYVGYRAINSALAGSVNLRNTAQAFRDLRTTGLTANLTEEGLEELAAVRTMSASTAEYLEKLDAALAKLPAVEQSLGPVQAITKWGLREFLALPTTVPNFIKNSLLGGAWLPNFPYQFTNNFTASWIINQQLRGREGAIGINTVADHIKWASQLPANIQNATNKWTAGLTPAYVGDDVVVVQTDLGFAYTRRMILDIETRYGIDSASIGAEVTTDMIRDSLAYVSRLPSGEYTTLIKELSKADVAALKSRAADAIGLTGLSMWNKAAQEMDLTWRRMILMESLQKGETVQQAVATARAALFDYSQLSPVTRGIWAKTVWFWRFTEANMVSTISLFLDNPMRFARLAKNAKNVGSLLGGENNNPDLQDYKETASFIKLIELVDGQRVGIYTPSQPILEGMSFMIDMLSMFELMRHPDAITFEVRGKALAQDLGGNIGVDLFNIATQTTAGYRFTDDWLIRENNINYIDPVLVAWMKKTGTWEMFNSTFLVERSSTPPSASSTTYDGYYYKLADDAKTIAAWTALTQAVKVVGLGRALKDTAPITSYAATSDAEIRADIATGVPSIDIAEALGLVKVTPYSDINTVEERNRRAILRELKHGDN